MKADPDPISVLKYDAVVRLLTDEPDLPHDAVASRCGVAPSTVERIWNGAINRPSVVVVDRLPSPKRCPDCGGLCREWPCIFCEMVRRKRSGGLSIPVTRFLYRSQSK